MFLAAKWPGILRWMIEGALDWQANGLLRPPSVIAETEEYFSLQDLLGEWLDECCDFEPGNNYKWESVADLFASWREFAEAAGEEPGTRKNFGDLLQGRGAERHRTSTARGFQGIRLKRQRLYDDG